MQPFTSSIFSGELPYGLYSCCVFFQINKPYLPLASGEYSFGTGVAIVASFSILVPHRFVPFFNDICQDKMY